MGQRVESGSQPMRDAVAETQEQIRLWIANDAPVYFRARGILAGQEPYPNRPGISEQGPRVEQLAGLVERVIFDDPLGLYYRRLAAEVHKNQSASNGAIRSLRTGYGVKREHLHAPEFDWVEIAEAIDSDNELGWR